MITLKPPAARNFVAAALLLAAPAALHAQRAAGTDLWLPLDHWWRQAAVRLHALGATSGGDPAVLAGGPGAPPAAAAAAPAVQRLAATYHARLARELGGAPGQRADIPPAWHVAVAPLLSARRGVVRAGRFTPDREWTGVMAEPDHTSAGVRAHGFVRAAPWLAVSGAASSMTSDIALDRAVAEAASGPIAAWVGRRTLGYAPASGGGLVLRRVDRLDGAGVAFGPHPVWRAGAVSAQLFAGRLPASGQVARPWLLGMRAHAAPHRRVDVGATRAAIFGGIGGAALGLHELAQVVVGANLAGDHADDQVVSIDARWRPPGGALPLELFGEWGMHDIDFGVLVDMPTFTLGVRAPLLPGTDLGVTLQHTQVAGSCCGNPPWYHHYELADSWTLRGRPLGHELGGHGREWRAALAGGAAAWRGVHELHVFVRTRGAENLYAPQRAGRSTGAVLRVDAAVAPRVALEFAFAAERGRGWRELHATLATRWQP